MYLVWSLHVLSNRVDICRSVTRTQAAAQLEHDPEKWMPVFRKDHAQNKEIEQDDDSKISRPALGRLGTKRLEYGFCSLFFWKRTEERYVPGRRNLTSYFPD